jgi:hypothetical protein
LNRFLNRLLRLPPARGQEVKKYQPRLRSELADKVFPHGPKTLSTGLAASGVRMAHPKLPPAYEIARIVSVYRSPFLAIVHQVDTIALHLTVSQVDITE